MKLDVEIDREEIVEAVADKVYDGISCGEYGVHERVEQKLGEMVAASVEEEVQRITSERIAAAVDEVLAAGWARTNQYGEHVGKVAGLKERISELMTENVERSYSNKGSRVDVAIREAIDKALANEFKAVIADAAKRFREQVDAVMTAKLAETLKNALGLK